MSDAEIDRELLDELRGGDQNALAKLYDRHVRVMFGLALRILGGATDAEDLVHDVLLEAWARSGAFDPTRGTVRAWLLARIRSRALDRLRSRGRANEYRQVQQRERGAAPSREIDQSFGPDQRRARRAVAKLSEVQRVVIELAYFKGLSCSEIAVECGLPHGTVKSRLAAAMRALRSELGSGEVS